MHGRSDLQTHAQLVNNNLQAITSQLSEYGDSFRSTVAFPTPAFPGIRSQNVLETLMRTKLEPSIEDWVKEGENATAQQRKATFRGLSDKDRDEVWNWAPGEANAFARKQTWGGDYTRSESLAGVDNVVTGLKRQLVKPPDDDDDEGPDDDDEDEYEVSDEEEEGDGAMDVEQQQAKTEPKPAAENRAARPTPGQISLANIHKFMTIGPDLEKQKGKEGAT